MEIRFKSLLRPNVGLVYQSSETDNFDQCYRSAGILSWRSFWYETFGDNGVQHSPLRCVAHGADGADWMLSLAAHLTTHPEDYKDSSLSSLFGYGQIQKETAEFLDGLKFVEGYYSVQELKVSKKSDKAYDKRWFQIPSEPFKQGYRLDRIFDLYRMGLTSDCRFKYIEQIGIYLSLAQHLDCYVNVCSSDSLAKWLDEDSLRAAKILWQVLNALELWNNARWTVESEVGNFERNAKARTEQAA